MLRLVVILTFLAGPLFADVTGQMNAVRAKRGLPPISVSPKLQRAAEAHARDMMKNNYYSHRGRDGSTAGKRARRAGYRWCLVAENIAKGQKSVGQVMNDWITSPSHYKNITRRKIKEYGMARAGNVWVMVLGARRC